jgi:hypothetical protein
LNGRNNNKKPHVLNNGQLVVHFSNGSIMSVNRMVTVV